MLAACEGLFRRERCEELHRAGDHSGPARLVAGADPGAGVAMEMTSALYM